MNILVVLVCLCFAAADDDVMTCTSDASCSDTAQQVSDSTERLSWENARQTFQDDQLVLFYMHLPKTGGTDLSKVLIHNFLIRNRTVCIFAYGKLPSTSYYDKNTYRPELDIHYIRNSVYLIPEDDGGTFIPLEHPYNDIRSVAKCSLWIGHADRLFVDKLREQVHSINKQLLVLTTVRNPVNRYISSFEHFCRFPSINITANEVNLMVFHQAMHHFNGNLQLSYFSPQPLKSIVLRVCLRDSYVAAAYEWLYNRTFDFPDCVQRLCDGVFLGNCLYYDTQNLTEEFVANTMKQSMQERLDIAKTFLEDRSVLAVPSEGRQQFLPLIRHYLGLNRTSLKQDPINVNPLRINSSISDIYRKKYNNTFVYKRIVQSESFDNALYNFVIKIFVDRFQRFTGRMEAQHSEEERSWNAL